jgi:uncharacterized surface protein with fasciclin (FAS1) repeats
MTRVINKAVPLVTAAMMLTAMAASLSAIAGGHSSNSDKGDIVDVAVSAGQFNTLAAALEAADLVSTLKGDGPFTVFAPTDEAFEKLPEGTLESLLKPENRDQLISILTYHVVPGKVMAGDVATLSQAETVNGANISIRIVDDNVLINDATVLAADVDASNGVIHVIDKVILPL